MSAMRFRWVSPGLVAGLWGCLAEPAPDVGAGRADAATAAEGCPDPATPTDVGDRLSLEPALSFPYPMDSSRPQRFTSELVVSERTENGRLARLTADGLEVTLSVPDEAEGLRLALTPGRRVWLDFARVAHGFAGGAEAWILRTGPNGPLLAAGATGTSGYEREVLPEVFAPAGIGVEVLGTTCPPVPAYCFSEVRFHVVRVRMGETSVERVAGDAELGPAGARYVVRIGEATTGRDDARGHQCADDPAAALGVRIFRVDPEDSPGACLDCPRCSCADGTHLADGACWSAGEAPPVGLWICRAGPCVRWRELGVRA